MADPELDSKLAAARSAGRSGTLGATLFVGGAVCATLAYACGNFGSTASSSSNGSGGTMGAVLLGYGLSSCFGVVAVACLVGAYFASRADRAAMRRARGEEP